MGRRTSFSVSQQLRTELSAKKLTKTSTLPNCEVPNGFFWYNCKFYHSKTALGKEDTVIILLIA
jgi:hypothetical protein